MIQRLEALPIRYGGVLIPDSEVDRQMRVEAPVVVGKKIGGNLIPVIGSCIDTTLGKVVRSKVVDELVENRIVVIASFALRELLRGNELPPVETDLNLVFALVPANVVRKLVGIQNRKLGTVRVGSNLNSQVIVYRNIGERIEARVRRCRHRRGIVIPVVTEAEFVYHIGAEIVIFREREQVLTGRRSAVENRQIRICINRIDSIIDIAAPPLVLLRCGIVHAIHHVVTISEVGRSERKRSNRYTHAILTFRLAIRTNNRWIPFCDWRHRHILV